jgi:hypothetical protein
MTIDGHKHERREVHSHKRKAEMDKELSEIQVQMEELAFNIQHESKVHWRYEGLLKRTTKWHVHKILSRSKQHMLKRWLRHDGDLSHEGKISGKSLIDILLSLLLSIENKQCTDSLATCPSRSNGMD